MLKKKVCMVGQFGVGKTSLVRRFVESVFDDRYHTTLGVKVDRKDLTVGSRAMTLMLWDMAGEDDFTQLKMPHLRGASGFILVADGCSESSFQKAIELEKRIIGECGPLPFVAALNKADLKDRWELRQNEVQASGWQAFETSARMGTGVEEMFAALAVKLLAGEGT